MAQPPARRHSGPTVYLMGFSCLPGDREYSEAQRVTGSDTPYWFKERFIYEELRAKPHTRTTTAAETKSDMADVHMREKKAKAVKEKDKKAKEKASGKQGNAEGKEKKDSVMEKTKSEKSGTKESHEKRDKSNKKAHNPRRNKSLSQKTKTLLLPGKRVRFAWTIAIMTKRQIPHALRAKQIPKRSLTNGVKPKTKKSTSSDKATINTTAEEGDKEEEDTEPLHLLDRFPSPPRSRQPTPSLSDAIPQQLHDHQGHQETQMATPPLLSQSQTDTPPQLQHTAATYTSSDDTLERDESGVHGGQQQQQQQQEGEKNTLWGTFLRFCQGKRK